MDLSFKLTLSIKKEKDGSPVFYKVDGGRFDKEKTLKLMKNTKYRMDFSFKPTQTMVAANILGAEMDVIEKVYDSTASAFSSHINTDDVKVTRKGERDKLPILIQLKGGVLLQILLQVKYYKNGDTQHCDWGSTFHCVEYHCSNKTQPNIISLIKETFR